MTNNCRYLLFVVIDVCVAVGASGGDSVCGDVPLLLIFLVYYMIYFPCFHDCSQSPLIGVFL